MADHVAEDRAQPVSNEALLARINELEESLKEREPSIFRAIKTFMEDFAAFHAGQRNFPQSAALGVILAYLRPRIIIVLGSIGAVVFAGMQVWLLLSQNRLIEQQNVLIQSQASSNRMQAVAAVLADWPAENPSRAQLAQLSVFGQEGFDVLLEMTELGDTNALNALMSGAASHTPVQTARVFTALLAKLHRIPADGPEEKETRSITDWLTNKNARPEFAISPEETKAISVYFSLANIPDFSALDSFEMNSLEQVVSGIYARMSASYPLSSHPEDLYARVLDDSLTVICGQVLGATPPANLWSTLGKAAASLSGEQQQDHSASFLVNEVIHLRCSRPGGPRALPANQIETIQRIEEVVSNEKPESW